MLDPTDPSSYFPISNLLLLGKVINRVAEQLQNFQEDMSKLDPFLSGFNTGHGMETALVTLIEEPCRQLDQGSLAVLLLLDLSAAFNMVDCWPIVLPSWEFVGKL